MKNSYGTGKVLGGILVGTIFGSMLTILFSNKKCHKIQCDHLVGEEESVKDIRKRMKKEANNMRKKAEELENLAKD